MAMTNEPLSDLFVEGTTRETDCAFTLQVAAEIGRARNRIRLLALAWRVIPGLVLFVAAFVASRLIEPVLAPLVEAMPQFMGVPVPMVALGIVVSGLALRARPLGPVRHSKTSAS